MVKGPVPAVNLSAWLGSDPADVKARLPEVGGSGRVSRSQLSRPEDGGRLSSQPGHTPVTDAALRIPVFITAKPGLASHFAVKSRLALGGRFSGDGFSQVVRDGAARDHSRGGRCSAVRRDQARRYRQDADLQPVGVEELTGFDPHDAEGSIFFTELAPCTSNRLFYGRFREGMAASERWTSCFPLPSPIACGQTVVTVARAAD